MNSAFGTERSDTDAYSNLLEDCQNRRTRLREWIQQDNHWRVPLRYGICVSSAVSDWWLNPQTKNICFSMRSSRLVESVFEAINSDTTVGRKISSQRRMAVWEAQLMVVIPQPRCGMLVKRLCSGPRPETVIFLSMTIL